MRTIGRRAFSSGTDCAAILRPSGICKRKVTCMCAAGNALENTVITGSNRIIVTSSVDCAPCQGPRTTATAWAVIQGIEAAQIRKGQVLGITSHNLFGQAWVFGALLKAA
jgi:hypothetical protein